MAREPELFGAEAKTLCENLFGDCQPLLLDYPHLVINAGKNPGIGLRGVCQVFRTRLRLVGNIGASLLAALENESGKVLADVSSQELTFDLLYCAWDVKTNQDRVLISGINWDSGLPVAIDSRVPHDVAL